MPAPDATAAHPSARSLAWLAAAAAAAVLVTAVATAAMTHSSLPHEDEWYSLDLYAAALRGDFLPRLLSQHNEHRIAFPRLLFWTDYALLDGTGRVDLAATFVVQGLEACLLAWVAAKAGVGTALTLATGAMATVLLFSLRQYENLTWGFQTQFVGVFAAASLAVALHARSMAAPDGRGAAWPLLAALGMTFVATYTMANGLLVGFVLAASALARRAPRAQWLSPLLLAATLLAGYVHGFEPRPDAPGPGAYLGHPLTLATFALSYLGSIVPGGVVPAIPVGVVGVLALTALTRDALARRAPWAVTCAGIAWFCASSAALTAFGRAPFGLDGAAESRYATGSAVFWCATLTYGIVAAASAGPHRRALAAATLAACCALTVAVGLGERTYLLEAEAQAARRDVIEDALLLGLHDPDANADEESGDRIVDVTPFIRSKGISIFSDGDARLVGRPLGEAGTLAAAACPADFAATSRPSIGPSGTVAAGTTSVETRLPRTRRVYLVDDGGRIVGLGTAPARGRSWKGYATAGTGQRLSAYALSDGGRLCAMGRVEVAPAPPSEREDG